MPFIFLVYLTFLSQLHVSDEPFVLELPEFPEEVPRKKKFRIAKTVSPRTVQKQVYWACLRKQNLSEEEANQVVDKHLKRGQLLYYYKCDFCSSFHMTHNPPIPPKRDFQFV